MKSLAGKITLLFSILVVLSILVVAVTSIRNASSSLQESAFMKIEAVHAIKKEQILNYFNEKLRDVEMQSNSKNTRETIKNLIIYHDYVVARTPENFDTSSSNPDTRKIYDVITNNSDMFFSIYTENYGYDDVLLLCWEHGHVLYSLRKGNELGLNLSAAEYSSTHLAELWGKIRETNKPVITDMIQYSPSNNAPVMFTGAPITIDGEQLGVIVLRVSSEKIDHIMHERTGLGETGKTYLVGDDMLMRSNSRFQEKSTILKETVDTVAGRSAKDNTEGRGIIEDYRRKKVLSVYSHLGADEYFNADFEWSIIAEIDEAEINKPIKDLSFSIMVDALIVLLTAIILAVVFSKSLSKPLISMTRTADRIANGDFSKKIENISSDEIGDLAVSLNTMTSHLEDLFSKNEDQLWLVRGISKIGEIIRKESEIIEIASLLCQFFAKYLDAQIITFYILSNSKLELAGSYAFSKHKSLGNTIDIGEGFAGQAALEKQIISVLDIPDDYTRINSSIGGAKPKNIVAVPFLFNNKVQGVMELGSFSEISEKKLELLKGSMEPIGITISTSNEQIKTKMLLEKTQRQAEELQTQQEELQTQQEELQTQQEELQVTNESLEEQTQLLKQSEEELKQQSEELRVSNEELTEKQEILTKQYDELEWSKWGIEVKAGELRQVSKYKSEFLANMSHELRTPLNSMLLLSKSLAENKKGNLTEEQIEDAKVINDGGNDLLTLINDIMDLSKVEAGMLIVNIEDVKIDTISSILHKYFDPIAKSKNLTFKIEKDKSLPESIKTDSKRLEQILKNFLSNSMKFTEDGSVMLLIQQPESGIKFKQNSLSSETAIAFTVIDTGIGIPADKQDAIFEAFQQQDGSTNRKYGGTGLGLSISKELASLLYGEIQLESNHGHGSTFTLYLPQEYKQKDMDQITAKSSIPSPGEHETPQKLPESAEITSPDISEPQFIEDDRNDIHKDENSFLIIEDDERFAKILRDHVREFGYNCLVSDKGRTGLYLAREYQPNGIILDIGLPDINGLQVLEQLKYSLKTRHIPVHIISSQDRDQGQSMLQGAIGYLTKPVTGEQLSTVFRKLDEIAAKNIDKILIVEDNKTSQKILERILENKKIEITYAGTGEKACTEILSNEYDCVILDLCLPDMSGFDVLKSINENKSIRKPPVIIYSGKEISDEEQAILDKYSATIIVKGAGSDERLIDELSLFLHSTEGNYKKDRRKTTRMLHDDDAMLKDRKILLVDDDMRNTYALSRMLIEVGLNVDMAKNGREAVDILEKDNSYELVLMDIMMPVMDGYEATEYIRNMQEYKNIPIIALTAKAMPEDRDRCLEAGASEYMIKPVDFEKLLSILRIWLFKQV